MGKFLKYSGITFGSLTALALIILGVVFLITEMHRKQSYELVTEHVEVSDDPEVLAHGKHVFTIRGCVDCHGENLGGSIFQENGTVGRWVASNLTSGEGGLGREYTDEDFVRAVRGGVRKDGRSVLFMPSYEYNLINKKDMSAMISYIRHSAPVDNVMPESKVGLPIRLIYLLDKNFHLFPARAIDHSISLPEHEPASILEQGEYLAATCVGCHGANLSGGKIPGVPPDWPDAPNLTPGGNLTSWGEADFFKAMREGTTPDGREMQPEFMPYPAIGQMTDDELHSIFTYLQSLDALATGER